MARRLYAFLSETSDGPLDVYDPEADAWLETASLEGNDELILFANGNAVTVLSAVLPARSDRELRQAAPFAIEDDIGSDLDDIHIAFGAKPSDTAQPRTLLITSRDQMDQWLALASSIPAKSVRIIPEQILVQTGQALVLPDRVLGHGDKGPFVADRALGDDLIDFLTDGLNKVFPDLDGLADLIGLFEESTAPINLLQGAYRLKGNSGSGLSIGPWRVPIALAAALMLTWFGSMHFETRAYQAATLDMEQQMLSEYQKVFPNEPAPRNAVRSLSRKLGAGGGTQPGGLDFLQTTSALYQAVFELDAAQMRSLRFDPQRGGVFASMTYADYGYDAELKALLEEVGFVVSIGDARRTNEGVQGDVIVEGLQ